MSTHTFPSLLCPFHGQNAHYHVISERIERERERENGKNPCPECGYFRVKRSLNIKPIEKKKRTQNRTKLTHTYTWEERKSKVKESKANRNRTDPNCSAGDINQ